MKKGDFFLILLPFFDRLETTSVILISVFRDDSSSDEYNKPVRPKSTVRRNSDASEGEEAMSGTKNQELGPLLSPKSLQTTAKIVTVLRQAGNMGVPVVSLSQKKIFSESGANLILHLSLYMGIPCILSYMFMNFF